MNPGSKKFEVDPDLIRRYRRKRLSWTDIATLLDTTTKTLGKWRIRNEYEVGHIFINDLIKMVF